MAQKIFQLIYVSKASEDISYSDLKNILNTSEKNNKEEKLTGILIFRDGLFLQLLEGTPSAVKNALSRIIKDTRHSHLKVIVERETPHRVFQNWPMAFLDGDIVQTPEEDDIFQRVLSDAFLAPSEKIEDLLEELVLISKSPSYLV